MKLPLTILTLCPLLMSSLAWALYNGAKDSHPRSGMVDWHNCRGVLLEDNIVLTAAHCVDDEPPQTFTLDGTVYGVKNYEIHPDYRTYFDVASAKDIALLILSTSVSQAEKLEPLYLSKGIPLEGLTGKFYGKNHEDHQFRTEPLSALFEIKEISLLFEAEDMMLLDPASNYPNARACNGDSGGPFIMEVNKREYLVGVASYGGLVGLDLVNPLKWFSRKCRDKYLRVTSISYHRDWIIQTIRKLRGEPSDLTGEEQSRPHVSQNYIKGIFPDGNPMLKRSDTKSAGAR